MNGVQLMQKLRGAMTDQPNEMLNDSKLLRIGREVLADHPTCDALTIVNAYRNYGFTMAKAHGKSPEHIAVLMERQDWIQNTLNKVEQIHRDGEYLADMLLPKALIPVEERIGPPSPTVTALPVEPPKLPERPEWSHEPPKVDSTQRRVIDARCKP